MDQFPIGSLFRGRINPKCFCLALGPDCFLVLYPIKHTHKFNRHNVGSISDWELISVDKDQVS